jgi:hypothetical protein
MQRCAFVHDNSNDKTIEAVGHETFQINPGLYRYIEMTDRNHSHFIR